MDAMMMLQNPELVRSTWYSLFELVVGSVMQLHDKSSPALINLWTSHGGGRTTFLQQVQKLLVEYPLIRCIGPWQLAHLNTEELASELSEALEDLSEGEVLAVLLDDLDVLLSNGDELTFFQFEEDVVRPLINSRKALVVATSQSRLIQWREYDVRIRSQSIQIPFLERGEIERMAEAKGISASLAWSVSLGYPQVLEWLSKEPDLPMPVLYDRIEDFLLSDFSQETRHLAQSASLFLLFDVAVLRSVLTGEGDDIQNSDGLYATYLEQIQQLRRAGLVLWDLGTKAYRFSNGVVRRLLATQFFLKNPDSFNMLHKAAFEYYEDAARRSTYLHLSLPSTLYHLIQASRIDRHDVIIEKCIAWVEQNQHNWYGANWSQVRQAWLTAHDDPVTVEEMRECLSPQGFDQITNLIDTLSKEMEAVA